MRPAGREACGPAEQQGCGEQKSSGARKCLQFSAGPDGGFVITAIKLLLQNRNHPAHLWSWSGAPNQAAGGRIHPPQLCQSRGQAWPVLELLCLPSCLPGCRAGLVARVGMSQAGWEGQTDRLP